MNNTSLQLVWSRSLDTPEGWCSWNSFAHSSKHSNQQLIPIKGSVGAHTVKVQRNQIPALPTPTWSKKFKSLQCSWLSKNLFHLQQSFPQTFKSKSLTRWRSVSSGSRSHHGPLSFIFFNQYAIIALQGLVQHFELQISCCCLLITTKLLQLYYRYSSIHGAASIL